MLKYRQAVVSEVYPEMIAFLERYRRAFECSDTHQILAYFTFPSIIANATGQSVYVTPDTLQRDHIHPLVRVYKLHGFDHATFDLCEVVPQGRSLISIKVFWTLERCPDARVWQFHTVYHLRKEAEDWKIYGISAYEDI